MKQYIEIIDVVARQILDSRCFPTVEVEVYLEVVQHQAFMEEERAYCQGYVDCIQLLAGLGMLNSNPNIEQIIAKVKK